MRVLVIEDDTTVSGAIELMLRTEKCRVQIADCGEEGVDLGKIYAYDIITCDIDLPDFLGFEVVRQLRTAKIKTPILMLSGRAGITDKVKALSLGADDYMTKPFHKDELVARINAIVRRSAGHAESTIVIDDMLTLNLDKRVAETAGKTIPLTGKEYQMLEALAMRKGMTVSKEMILDHLYGGMDEPELKIIDVFICKLRKKLEKACDGRRHVQTIWGRGYTIRAAESEAPTKPLGPADPDARNLVESNWSTTPR